MELSHKRNIFAQFFWHSRNLDSILIIFRKKMALIVDLFLNVQTPKNVVT